MAPGFRIDLDENLRELGLTAPEEDGDLPNTDVLPSMPSPRNVGQAGYQAPSDFQNQRVGIVDLDALMESQGLTWAEDGVGSPDDTDVLPTTPDPSAMSLGDEMAGRFKVGLQQYGVQLPARS